MPRTAHCRGCSRHGSSDGTQLGNPFGVAFGVHALLDALASDHFLATESSVWNATYPGDSSGTCGLGLHDLGAGHLKQCKASSKGGILPNGESFEGVSEGYAFLCSLFQNDPKAA